MLAAMLYKPMDLRLEDADTPQPSMHELLIKVDVSGLCPTDVKTYRYGSAAARYPVILGHEVAGTVISDGGSAGFEKGTKVCVAADAFCGTCKWCLSGAENLCTMPLSLGFNVNGAHADYLRVPQRFIEHGGVLRTGNLDQEVAALTEPFACTLHSLNAVDAQHCRSLAIIGDGPMAMLHLILARLFGVEDIAVIGLSEWKLHLAEELGATVVLHNHSDPADALASGAGMDAVVVTVVSAQTVLQAVRMASRKGKINVFAGLPSERMPLGIDTNAIHYHELTLTGSSGYTYEEFRNAFSLLSSASQSVKRIISNRFSLSDLLKAIECWDDKEKSMKVMIRH